MIHCHLKEIKALYFNIHSEFALPSLSMSSIGPALTMSASTTMINPQHHHSQNRGLVHHLHHLHMHFNKQDPAVREELVREMTAALGTVFSGEKSEISISDSYLGFGLNCLPMHCLSAYRGNILMPFLELSRIIFALCNLILFSIQALTCCDG